MPTIHLAWTSTLRVMQRTERGKKADIADLTEPAYPYEGGKYYEEKQSREEGQGVKI